MKTVINLVLAACAVVLVYICYGSIMGPINFDKEKKVREDAIIARLIDIRKAQQEYRTVHACIYCKFRFSYRLRKNSKITVHYESWCFD